MTTIGFWLLCAISNKLYNKVCLLCWVNKSNSSRIIMTGFEVFVPMESTFNKYDNTSENEVFVIFN